MRNESKRHTTTTSGQRFRHSIGMFKEYDSLGTHQHQKIRTCLVDYDRLNARMGAPVKKNLCSAIPLLGLCETYFYVCNIKRNTFTYLFI